MGIAAFLVWTFRGRSTSSAIRYGLLGVIGGLLGYDLYALGVPGALQVSRVSEKWGAVIVTALGCMFALVVGVLWNLIVRRVRVEES